jgi:hypothetical protein
VIGDVRDVTRFTNRDRFAACNGTTPVGVSSGSRTACRLSLRGNRRLNHAVHMAAVTQVSHRTSDGRACYDKKIAQGKTPEEELRALKRKISGSICRHLKADAARAAAGGPGGQPGNGSAASAAGSHPERRLFGQATPGPVPTLRPRRRTTKKTVPRTTRKTREPFDAKEVFDLHAFASVSVASLITHSSVFCGRPRARWIPAVSAPGGGCGRPAGGWWAGRDPAEHRQAVR